MARNTFPKSAVRQPRALVLINGVRAPFVSFDIETHILSHSDRGRVLLPASVLPEAISPVKLIAAEAISVEVQAGFPADPDNFGPGEMPTVFMGDADTMRASAHDATIELEARCYSARLVDATTSQQYRNKTASDVVKILAGEHGLAAVVTATNRTIGRFYKSDTAVRTHSERSKWDLLAWLAREEGFVIYVQGKTLHFEPRPQPTQTPYIVRWTPARKTGGGVDPIHRADAVSLEITRNISQAQSVKVIVRSWNAAAKRTYSATVARKKGTAEPTEYTYNIPGLTQAQCDERAKAILNEITQHELRLRMDGPADDVLKITDIVKIEGSAFDGTFYVDSIARRFSRTEGYVWTVDGRTTGIGDETSEGLA